MNKTISMEWDVSYETSGYIGMPIREIIKCTVKSIGLLAVGYPLDVYFKDGEWSENRNGMPVAEGRVVNVEACMDDFNSNIIISEIMLFNIKKDFLMNLDKEMGTAKEKSELLLTELMIKHRSDYLGRGQMNQYLEYLKERDRKIIKNRKPRKTIKLNQIMRSM